MHIIEKSFYAILAATMLVVASVDAFAGPKAGAGSGATACGGSGQPACTNSGGK